MQMLPVPCCECLCCWFCCCCMARNPLMNGSCKTSRRSSSAYTPRRHDVLLASVRSLRAASSAATSCLMAVLLAASTCFRNSSAVPRDLDGGIALSSFCPAPYRSFSSRSPEVLTQRYTNTPSAPPTMASSRVGLNTMHIAGPCTHFMLEMSSNLSSYTLRVESRADARYILCWGTYVRVVRKHWLLDGKCSDATSSGFTLGMVSPTLLQSLTPFSSRLTKCRLRALNATARMGQRWRLKWHSSENPLRMDSSSASAEEDIFVVDGWWRRRERMSRSRMYSLPRSLFQQRRAHTGAALV
mmetsp:Transcript_16393/g.40109  ORF Transcript_16393/g.40109 Transcript_16393/m.40109 type:complete len:299 (+) Transcript_16393:436-1332(+)